MNRTESWVFSIVAAIILFACVYMISTLLTVAAQIAVALVAVVGGIVAAVIKHGFDLERERRHAVFLAKQKNYAELLASIGNFARKKEGAFDALCSAHLASWAFGDYKVVVATNALMAVPGTDALVKLLAAVRDSLAEEGSTESPLIVTKLTADGYKTDLLFGPRTSDGFK